MKYLITGGCGFVGTNLTQALLARGDEVMVLDMQGHENFSGTRTARLTLRQGSVTDSELLDSLLPKAEYVVHLAATVGVRNVVERPLDSLLNNLRCSLSVFQACERYEVPVLFTSSSEMFGSTDGDPLAERSFAQLGPTWVPRWSYGYGKAAEEALLFGYHAQLGLPVTIVRLFNPTGVRHWKGVIPTFARQAVRNETITVHGDGSQKRSFTHVSDLVDALLLCIDSKQAVGEVFNLGTDEATTIADLAVSIKSYSMSDAEVKFVPYDEAYDPEFEDASNRFCDASKMKEMLGWRPKYTLDDIVKDAVHNAQVELASERVEWER